MALYLYQQQALMLRIPKTGCVWAEQAIRECGIECSWATGRHGLPQQIRHLPKPVRFSFTFVRHPVEWYISNWRYYQDHDLPAGDDVGWYPQLCLPSPIECPFHEWVELCMTQQPAYVTRMYEWYCGPPHLRSVGFVGRTEHLRRDLANALGFAGYKLTERQKLTIDTLADANKSHVPRPAIGDGLLARLQANEREAFGRFYGV